MQTEVDKKEQLIFWFWGKKKKPQMEKLSPCYSDL